MSAWLDTVGRPCRTTIAAGGVLFLAIVGLALLSPGFEWSRPAGSRPTPAACGLIALAGLAFVVMARAVILGRGLALVPMIAVGLALRLVMVGSIPIWEDDFYRYQWDGAAVSRGLDPYRVSPMLAADAAAPAGWQALSQAEPELRDRVNHPQFRTLYPAVAQGAFAGAQALGGGVFGLRFVILAAEAVGLFLLLILLGRNGLPLGWSALYWLNPLAVVSFINGVHFDALLIPLILGGLLAMTTRRSAIGSALIGLAAGVKLWPILLWPLAIRMAGRIGPARWILGAGLAGGIALASVAPIVLAGLGSDAGLVAYAETWTRNSAVHPVLFDVATAIVRAAGLIQVMDPQRTVRVLLGMTGAIVALLLAVRAEPGRLNASRLLLLACLILALSPAQYPWYGAALLPLAALAGAWRTAGMAAVVSAIYYLRFVLDEAGAVLTALVWVEHIALWGALFLDLRQPRVHADDLYRGTTGRA